MGDRVSKAVQHKRIRASQILMFRLFSDYLLQAKHLLNEFSVEGLKAAEWC